MEWYYILIIVTISIVNLVGAICYYAKIIEDCNYEYDNFYLCDECFEFRKPLHHSLYKDLNLFGKISFPILFTLIFPSVTISFLIYYIAMFIAVGIYLLCTFRPKKIDLFKVIKEKKRARTIKVRKSKKELLAEIEILKVENETQINSNYELHKIKKELEDRNRYLENRNTELVIILNEAQEKLRTQDKIILEQEKIINTPKHKKKLTRKQRRNHK